MERNESDPETDTNGKRRTVLKGIGMVGLGGTFGVGQAAARGGKGGNGGGPSDDNGNGPSENPGGGPPEKCDCPDDTFIAKYEFNGDSCEFVFEKGEDVVDITVSETKGDDCEPIGIKYTVSGFDIEKVCAFGGTDTATDDHPDGSFDAELTNPGGQRAAISNITFCGEEVDEPDPVCFQADLVGGEPIEEFEGEDQGYSDEDRLLDFLFACSDDEEGTNSEEFGSGGTSVPATVDGETCDFDWDAFVFDPDAQELTVEDLTLTSTTSETDECMASIAAYEIDPKLAKEGSSGDLTEQKFIDAETVTLKVGETRTVTLDLSDALP